VAAKKALPRLPVVPIEGSRFTVGSETQPGVTYEVDLARYACSCHAGQHGRLCKHVKAAQEFHNAKEEHVAKEEEQIGLGLEGVEVKVKPSNGSRPIALGYPFDQVSSALQKEIRHGDEEAAVWWGMLLYDAAPHYCWKRVLVSAAEDVGLAAPETVALVNSLVQAWAFCKQYSWYVDPQHIVMAIMALCRAPKSTEVDDLKNLTLESQKDAKTSPALLRPMPEYAIDEHTAAGKARGATDQEWYESRMALGVPTNPYTEKLWVMRPEWSPRGLE